MARASTANWILPLGSDAASLAVAGGKGANLALLTRAGLPVPGGFLVTTDAYRAYLAVNDLEDLTAERFKALQAGDPTALQSASEAIRARFAAGVVPLNLSAALRKAYAGLGRPPVAVRSSATAEDLPGMSFAGQQDTFLNVVGEEALLAAVVRCWSSLWTARAIGYRARMGVSQEGLALAVVVQEMMRSEASGVLFTADPLSGRRTEMVVEATLGLGEALVAGLVEPDRYRVEAASGRVLAVRLGAKALRIESEAGGGTVRVEEEAGTRQALPDLDIGELARLGRQAAGLLGGPQDVEWAWVEGRLYLLQSRPITALYPLPAGMPPEPLLVMFSFGAVQGILEPMTPLGRDAARALFAGASRMFGYLYTAETQAAIKEAGERLFINVTGLLRHEGLRRVMRAAIPMLEPTVAKALEGLWDDPRLAPVEGFGLRTLRRLVPFLVPAVARLLCSLLRPETERRRFEALLEMRLAEFEAGMARASTMGARVALIAEMLDGAFCFLLPQFVPRFGAGMGPLNMLLHLASDLPESEGDALVMTRGLPHNVTTEMDLALWEVAQRIRADREAAAFFDGADSGMLAAEYLAERLPAVAQAAVGNFLSCYGMRGPGEIDLGRPRWREDPRPILRVLGSYLQIEEVDQAPDAVFCRGAAAAEAAIERLAEEVRKTRGGWFRARQVRWAARRMRALAGLRESPKFWAVRAMGITRAALLEDGQELAAAGVLARADDLFFLRLAELRALAAGEVRDWRALAAERRRAYVREERRRHVPRLLLSDGQAFYEGMTSQVEEEDVLVGSPVSPGVVEGAVRVVLDPRDAKLVQGEILVCPGTDPAWTPLFLVAAGLVMEVGGLMTHGSVVAREYGIPAVVGVSQATARLQTGQRVRVDGTAGRVTILEEVELPQTDSGSGANPPFD